jgi:exocyst complex component 7
MFCSVMREAALNLTKSLAQTARETLVDFIETIEKATKNTIQDGNVHPLTIHVINCAKSLFE